MRTDRMAAAYDREKWSRRKNELLARIATSAVVGRVVALKKVSGAEWTGLCPFHVEKTPSFTVNDKKQFYHCFGCNHHGNAIDFVMARQGLEFMAAIELLESENGLRHLQAARPAPPPTRVEQREDLDKQRYVERIFAQCRWDRAVAAYLAGRAIVPPASYGYGDPAINEGWPADLLFHPGLWHGLEKREIPAMVAAIRRGGRLVGIHRTYLKVTGVGVTKAGTGSDKRMIGDIKGGLIHLGPIVDSMTGGEGIETSLSAMQLFKRGGFAFGTAGAMERGELPFEISDFLYAADWNAKSRVGERAAHAGAKANATGRRVAVKVPNLRYLPKADFNDVAMEQARIATQPSPFARAVASQKARGIDTTDSMFTGALTPADRRGRPT